MNHETQTKMAVGEDRNGPWNPRPGFALRLPWRHRARSCRAFTLVELLVVIAIIGLLAGLSIQFMGGSQTTVKRKKATSQIEALDLALEQFKLKNGEYPINEGDPEDGAAILYQALSGDGNDKLGFFGDAKPSSGQLGGDDGKGEVFLTALDVSADKQRMVAQVDGEYSVVDPWGNPYQYVRYKTPADRKAKEQNNEASYDLWSTGGADIDSDTEEDIAKWVTNW